MAKNYSYVYVDMASLLLALCKLDSYEAKGKFIEQVVECVITQKRGVNAFADSLMDNVDGFREEARLRKEKSMKRKNAEAVDEFPPAEIVPEIPTSEERPKPSRKKKVDDFENPEKKAYGTFGNVWLTDDQLSVLQKKYGENWEHALSILGSYKSSSGKTYKSDFAAFFSWVDKRMEEESAGTKTFRQLDREADAERAQNAFPEVMKEFNL